MSIVPQICGVETVVFTRVKKQSGEFGVLEVWMAVLREPRRLEHIQAMIRGALALVRS